jgi:hypothetical protein
MVKVIRKSPANLVTEDKLVPEKTIRVRVSDRWSVVHEDKRYVLDDELSVPENVAQEWERSRWVERVGKS